MYRACITTAEPSPSNKSLLRTGFGVGKGSLLASSMQHAAKGRVASLRFAHSGQANHQFHHAETALARNT